MSPLTDEEAEKIRRKTQRLLGISTSRRESNPDLAPASAACEAYGIASALKGSIVASIIGRGNTTEGLRFDLNRGRELLERAESDYQEASRYLGRFPETESCFHWEGQRVRRSINGHPKTKHGLDRWLGQVADNMIDCLGERVPIRQTASGQLLGLPENWGGLDRLQSSSLGLATITSVGSVSQSSEGSGRDCYPPLLDASLCEDI